MTLDTFAWRFLWWLIANLVIAFVLTVFINAGLGAVVAPVRINIVHAFIGFNVALAISGFIQGIKQGMANDEHTG